MKRTTLSAWIAQWLVVCVVAVRADTNGFPRWDVAALKKVPESASAREVPVPGLQALYVSGLPLAGRPTKFFAYLGVPTNTTVRSPGVVLVHGGGGTAFADWVKCWTAKGYVALALDCDGNIPERAGADKKSWKRIDDLGLPWGGSPDRPPQPFGDFAKPDSEQWTYHAVAQTLLATSLLAARPEVDAKRIGVVGISWGSVICSLAAGLDDRLAFVVVQYIGGNLDLGNVWYGFMRENPATFRWNPSNFYAPYRGRARWLWINGVNDKYGLPPMIAKSWRDTGPDSWMSLLPTQGHGHVWTEEGKNAVREIYAFADSVTRGAPGLTRIVKTTAGPGTLALAWREATPVTRAQLVYTTNAIPRIEIAGESRDDWEKVRYTMEDIALPPVAANPDGTRQAVFPLPTGMKAGFINLIDERGLAVSCDFQHNQVQP